MQEVALVDDQFSVDDPPCTTELGEDVSVKVGAGVGNVTATVTSLAVVPPVPVQVRVNVVVCDSAAVTCVPEVALAPLQPFDAVQDVALVVDHVSVDVPPCATWAGFAESVTAGGGGTVLTTTLADWVVEPPAPVHANVYV